MLKCFQGGTSIALPYASVNTQMCMGVIKPILFEGSSKQKDTAFGKRNTCKCLCMLRDEEILHQLIKTVVLTSGNTFCNYCPLI